MYDEGSDIRGLVKKIVPTYQIPQKSQEKELTNA
jgi:hypothetical protein